MRVSVNILKGNGNAMRLCDLMAQGIKASGDTAVARTANDHNMKGFDAALLWGFVTECQQIVAACKEANIPWVYMDNGYQLRSTHFKVAVNDRHPDAYLMKRDMPGDRYKKWGVEILPWRSNLTPADPIVVAGMSPKAAWSFGLAFEEYERATVAELRKHTKRPIIYRPKISNSPNAAPIPGSTFDGKEPISSVMARAHCVVSHHSNVGCDALLAGVPVFTRRGAALSMGISDDELNHVEEPFYPVDREQWACNLAYCQWSSPEMVSGECWRHMKTVIEHGA